MTERRLTDDGARERARGTRDWCWTVMERIDRCVTLWICPWNKYRMDEGPDELRLCLFSGCDWWEWANRHKDWFEVGEWSDERCADPVALTDAGRAALADREPYDMEDVHGGLVEPGYVVTPLPPPNSPAPDRGQHRSAR